MATATLLSRTLIYLHGVIIKTRGLIFALQRKSTNERRKNSIPEGGKQHFPEGGETGNELKASSIFLLLHSETVMCCVPSGRVSFAFVCCTSLSHALLLRQLTKRKEEEEGVRQTGTAHKGKRKPPRRHTTRDCHGM